MMLGYRAARNLDKTVGDTMQLGDAVYRVVGSFATDQEFGDSASMLPLVTLQAERTANPATSPSRSPGCGLVPTSKPCGSASNSDFPQLITVRHGRRSSGRADRNLAAAVGSRRRRHASWPCSIGVIIVDQHDAADLLRTDPGVRVLRAIGWSRRRVMSLVIGETLMSAWRGAAFGIGAVVRRHLRSCSTSSACRVSSLPSTRAPSSSGRCHGARHRLLRRRCTRRCGPRLLRAAGSVAP